MKPLFLFCISIFFLFTGLKAQTFIQYTYDDAGNRTVREIITLRLSNPNNNDSTASDSTKIDSTLLYTCILGNYNISVFPNPTQGLLTLQIYDNNSPEKPAMSEIFIYNLSGILIKQTTVNEIKQIIDFSAYAVGIYYLKVVINGKDKMFKVVKSS